MNVLVGCERSGVVRRAFNMRGHQAWSCDLEPAEDGSAYHLQCDVLEASAIRQWDLAIFHPPCTYLCASGARWMHDVEAGKRAELQERALALVWRLLNLDIQKIALENPVGAISTNIRPPDQVIQPWQFGHDRSKLTCLWLKNLPYLVPTNIVPSNGDIHTEAHGPDRAFERSRTPFQVAEAMAEQWG